MDETQKVLLSVEAEGIIEALEDYKIKDIGGPKWQKHHEYIEKLNMQALLSASQKEEEFIKETLITLDKIPILISDLIATEIWKQNVFKIILQTNFKPNSTIPLYMALYHEATLVNLIETVVFHKESLESAEDSVLDLLDYCYNKLTVAVSNSHKHKIEEITRDGNEPNCLEELKQQQSKIEFEISVKAISILRYITDSLESLPLSMLSRVLNTHNVPCLLVELLENPPWTSQEGGLTKKYIDGKWKELSGPDLLQLTKIEGQVWLSLYNLIMNPTCARKYDFNSFNKAQIMKVKTHLNEVLLDQLPILVEMRRYLEQISMTDSPPPKQDLILEQLPEIRDRIMKENNGKWKAIAKFQIKNYFNPSFEEIQKQAQRLADTYNFDAMDSLLSEVPKCSVCGEEATKRCSRCRQEWYCKRECQVQHWPKHKSVCNVMCGGDAKS